MVIITCLCLSAPNRETDRYSGFYEHVEHYLIRMNHPNHLHIFIRLFNVFTSLLILMPVIRGNTLFGVIAVAVTLQQVSWLSTRKSLNTGRFINQESVKMSHRNMFWHSDLNLLINYEELLCLTWGFKALSICYSSKGLWFVCWISNLQQVNQKALELFSCFQSWC